VSETTAKILSGGVLGISTLVLILIGIWLLKRAFNQVRLVLQSKGWPSVPGTVISSTVIKKINKHENNEGRVSYYSTYQPDIEFRYEVNSTSFTSYQRVIGDAPIFSDEKKANEIVTKYPVGKAISVSYPPQDPQSGVLEPGNFGNLWRDVVGGIIVLGVGYYMVKLIIIFISNT